MYIQILLLYVLVGVSLILSIISLAVSKKSNGKSIPKRKNIDNSFQNTNNYINNFNNTAIQNGPTVLCVKCHNRFNPKMGVCPKC